MTGNALKLIAVAAMLIDHAGVVLVERGLGRGSWSGLDFLLRTIGRTAFPIFCFLLVEGFLHTRDVRKYEARMLAFAIISEVPFDLAVFGKWFYPEYQNVYFTLFLGLCVLDGFRKASGRPARQALAILAGCMAALAVRCDYDIIGIFMILAFYMYHDNKRLRFLLAGGLAFLESLGYFGAALSAFIPIHMYNGRRGEKNLKYFFYCFYPAHLLLLYLIGLMIQEYLYAR